MKRVFLANNKQALVGSGIEIMRVYRKLYYSTNNEIDRTDWAPIYDRNSDHMYVLWIEPAGNSGYYWMFTLCANVAARWFVENEEEHYAG